MMLLLIQQKSRFIFLAALACLLLASVSVHAQTTQSPIPQPVPPTPVVDNANVIDDITEKRLNDLLMNLSENKQADVEMAVVTVRTTGGRDIFDYSLAVMRGWGIGDERTAKGGLLLLVAIDDRQYFAQISRHLEGDITDSLSGQIQRTYLVPALKQGQYSQGIYDTMMAYIATLSEKRGFSLAGLDKRYAQRPTTTTPGRPQRGGGISTCGIIIIVLIILIVLMLNRGRGGGGGCLNMLLLGTLLNSGRGSGWGGSGWGDGGGFGGGSGWGGGGGDGGGWGGFSGGGGDAGGGGSGGSW